MSVTATGLPPSSRAQFRPPKPPPTITTRWGLSGMVPPVFPPLPSGERAGVRGRLSRGADFQSAVFEVADYKSAPRKNSPSPPTPLPTGERGDQSQRLA